MLEILIISAVITAKLFAVDRQYAKRGETPPGYRLIERWLDGRKARGEVPASAKPAKYGMWRYFWQRWQALWASVSDEARIRDAALTKQRAEAAAKGWVPPKGPTLKEQLAADWQWIVDTVIAPRGEKKAEPAETEQPTGTLPADDDPASDGPRTACEDCGQTLVERDGGWDHPSSSGCPVQQATAQDQPVREHEPIVEASANVEAGTTEGEPDMTITQQSGEVVGLMSAINYAAAVASAHEAHSLGGGETYMASLAQAEVGPDTIQSAGAAQEASANAAGAWRAHEEKLKEQLAAKEAVTSETGKKEFLLAD